MTNSQPIAFHCRGSTLQAILETPDTPKNTAVVIVVGGPQYRVGSHRQFVLLARHLAGHGYATLRFDHRGIGDSDGATTFEALDDDIEAAIGELQRRLPNVQDIVLWGLCDGASAAMIYAANDPRVVGLVLLNPWVRSEQTYARSHFGGYYAPLLFSRVFWKRLLRGEVNIRDAVRSFLRNIRSAYGSATPEQAPQDLPFQKRMLEGMRSYSGKSLVILSGQDLTAREFSDAVSRDRDWRLLKHSASTEWRTLEDANHTFSTRAWRDEVANWTLGWLRSL